MINLIVGDGKIAPGSCYLGGTPALAQHQGSEHDLFLSWTAIDVAAPSVDVILYFHGFALSGEQQALLSDFVKFSGLDLMKSRREPCRPQETDHRHRPARQSQSRQASPSKPWPYHFPALFGGGADKLISRRAGGFHVCKKQQGGPDESLERDRLILMGHSGGGKGVVGTLPGLAAPADEFYLFDALYEDRSRADRSLRASAVPRRSRWTLGGAIASVAAVRRRRGSAAAKRPAAHARRRESRGRAHGRSRRYARGLLATGDAAANV